MADDGPKTWQEARDIEIEGNTWCVKNGVFPFVVPFRWAPGSVYSGDPSKRDKLAPTEYYLDIAVAHHEAMKEFDLYSKFNRLALCPMDCMIHTYIADLGILELGGNVGNWLSDLVPDKANWLAHFNSSMASFATESTIPNLSV